jgi:HK97 family phage portal protein
VYACVSLLAESVASLPLRIFERVGDGRNEATDHPLFYLLAVEPNPEMTAFTFIETWIGCLALTVNGYVELVENRAGDIGAMYPLHPLKTEPYRIADGGLVTMSNFAEVVGTRFLPERSQKRML